MTFTLVALFLILNFIFDIWFEFLFSKIVIFLWTLWLIALSLSSLIKFINYYNPHLDKKEWARQNESIDYGLSLDEQILQVLLVVFYLFPFREMLVISTVLYNVIGFVNYRRARAIDV